MYHSYKSTEMQIEIYTVVIIMNLIYNLLITMVMVAILNTVPALKTISLVIECALPKRFPNIIIFKRNRLKTC